MKTKHTPAKLTEAEIRAELEALGLTEWPRDQERDAWHTYVPTAHPGRIVDAYCRDGYKLTHYAILPGGYWSVGGVW